jgi:hypothetical protein
VGAPDAQQPRDARQAHKQQAGRAQQQQQLAVA